jgi:sugar (pentulose or hexulose) kinase
MLSGVPAESLWLGIDLGTQSVRAMVIDDGGARIASATQKLESVRDGALHEQDPSQWREAVAQTLREVTGSLAAHQKSLIGGAAVCGTSGTFTVLDAHGTPTTAGIMYDDSRAAASVDAVLEAGAPLWRKLGHRAQPTWAVTELAHLAKVCPDLLRTKGNRLAHQADVITGMLCGRAVATDSSHALKTGFDLVDMCWPADLLAALEIPETLLPDVVAPGTRLGTVCAEASRETGVPQGVPIVAGMTDGCAAQLSSGALRPGDWNCVLGTTLVVKGVGTEHRADPAGAVYSHRGAQPGTWLPGGASGVGAALIPRLFPGDEVETLSDDAPLEAAAIGYPLGGAGERFPFVATDAHGFVLHPETGAELGWRDAVRRLGAPRTFASLLVSVAYTEKLCFEVLNRAGFRTDGKRRLSGGAAANPVWNQLRADVLGTAVEIPAITEGAAGMALLAAWAHHGGDLPEVADRMIRVARTFTPSGRTHEQGYARFVDSLTERGWLRP